MIEFFLNIPKIKDKFTYINTIKYSGSLANSR